MRRRERQSGPVRTTASRSALMARVRRTGTAPELTVRRIVRGLGYCFAANGRELPGSPDLYDLQRKRAVFVHGCFWHRHRRCVACTSPKTNGTFWETKFEQNMARDRRNVRRLRRLGFRVLTVWECQMKTPTKLTRLRRRLDAFLRHEGQWQEQ